MERKIYKIQSATYETIWFFVGMALILGAVMFSVMAVTGSLLRVLIIVPASILAIGLYLWDIFGRLKQILVLEDHAFRLESSKGKVKWQVPIQSITRIDAEPYITNYQYFIRAFTFTTRDGKNHFVNLLPYEYRQLLNELQQENPLLELKTDIQARNQ